MDYAIIREGQINNWIEYKTVDFLTDIEKENLIIEGWSEVISLDNNINPNEYYVNKKEVFIKDGQFYSTYVSFIDYKKCGNEITNLKQQLSDTDYKVIKNMEAQLVNEELPYDSVTLHAERQALRDKINELEQLISGNSGYFKYISYIFINLI